MTLTFHSWRSVLFRFTVFAVLWWVLAEGNLYREWFALLVVLAATVVSLFAWKPGGGFFPWRALLGFLPYFLWHSVVAGIDVARRALAPRLDLDPALYTFTLRLHGSAARAFFAWLVSLFPGTAGIGLSDHSLEIHLLDRSFLSERALHALEDKVAALFGESLTTP
jgi:multicomponent Na+:H+ antiporter subunit E